MVKVILSKIVYEILMSLLKETLAQANRKFHDAPLNSQEESNASIQISFLMDAISQMVISREPVSMDDPTTGAVLNNLN